MKKYLLVSLMALLSVNLMAGKDNTKINAVAIQQMKACKNFWNPKIKEAKEAAQEVQELWDDMNQVARSLDQYIFERIIFFNRLTEKRKRARSYCHGNGLQASREVYEDAL